MAKAAIEQIQSAPKPNATLSDEQWATAKKDFMGLAPSARHGGPGAEEV